MPNPQEVKEELLKEFPKLIDDQRLIEESISACHFLSDFQQTLPALIRLNDDFKVQLGKNVDNAIQYYNAKIKYFEEFAKYQKAMDNKHKVLKPDPPAAVPKPEEIAHALTSVFARMEGASGFSLLPLRGRQAVPIYLKFLEPEKFLNQLKLKTHWKDPTVPGGHGEYTHRIQWYLLSVSGIRFGSLPNLFQFLGSNLYEKKKDISLWDFVCDRDSGNATFVPFKIDHKLLFKKLKTDFRAPETLNIFLLNAPKSDPELQKQLEPLSSFLRLRAAKRKRLQDPDSGEIYNYVSMKIFGRPRNLLNAEESTAVSDAVNLGIYMPRELNASQ